MDTKELSRKIREAVEDFIAGEEGYSDDVQLEINTTDWSVDIADPENDLPNCDYYPMMDMVKMSVSNPGRWEADEAAIESVAAEYMLD